MKVLIFKGYQQAFYANGTVFVKVIKNNNKYRYKIYSESYFSIKDILNDTSIVPYGIGNSIEDVKHSLLKEEKIKILDTYTKDTHPEIFI